MIIAGACVGFACMIGTRAAVPAGDFFGTCVIVTAAV